MRHNIRRKNSQKSCVRLQNTTKRIHQSLWSKDKSQAKKAKKELHTDIKYNKSTKPKTYWKMINPKK